MYHLPGRTHQRGGCRCCGVRMLGVVVLVVLRAVVSCTALHAGLTTARWVPSVRRARDLLCNAASACVRERVCWCLVSVRPLTRRAAAAAGMCVYMSRSRYLKTWAGCWRMFVHTCAAAARATCRACSASLWRPPAACVPPSAHTCSGRRPRCCHCWRPRWALQSSEALSGTPSGGWRLSLVD